MRDEIVAQCETGIPWNTTESASWMREAFLLRGRRLSRLCKSSLITIHEELTVCALICSTLAYKYVSLSLLTYDVCSPWLSWHFSQTERGNQWVKCKYYLLNIRMGNRTRLISQSQRRTNGKSTERPWTLSGSWVKASLAKFGKDYGTTRPLSPSRLSKPVRWTRGLNLTIRSQTNIYNLLFFL
jgi:hypothetical protein